MGAISLFESATVRSLSPSAQRIPCGLSLGCDDVIPSSSVSSSALGEVPLSCDMLSRNKRKQQKKNDEKSHGRWRTNTQ